MGMNLVLACVLTLAVSGAVTAHAQSSNYEFLDVEVSFVEMISTPDPGGSSGDLNVVLIQVNNTSATSLSSGEYSASVYVMDGDEPLEYSGWFWNRGPMAELCPKENITIQPRFTEHWNFCYKLLPDDTPTYMAIWSSTDRVIRFMQFDHDDDTADCTAHFTPEFCSPYTLDGEPTPGCWQLNRHDEYEWVCGGEAPPDSEPEPELGIWTPPPGLFDGIDTTTSTREFNVTYHDSTDPLYFGLRYWLELHEEDIIHGTELHEQVTWPGIINVEFMECGTVNAYYSLRDETITMCYELAEEFIEDGRRIDYRIDSVGEFTTDGLNWVFLHELGHAMIDIHELPTTGQEENVADQFANLMVIDAGMNHVGPLFVMAEMYSEFGYGLSWDTHSFDSQRYYNMLCLLYGKYGDDLGWEPEEYIPERRAVWCESEYNEASTAWDQILSTYVSN